MSSSTSGKKYRYLDHTADIEFVAFGKTKEEAFANSLLAMFNVISDTDKLSASKSRTKRIKIADAAPDMEELLWRVLQDALSNADAEGMFAYDVESVSIKEKDGSYRFSAYVLCRGKDPDLAKFDVKGVSRFDMKLSSDNGGFSASVVLDV